MNNLFFPLVIIKKNTFNSYMILHLSQIHLLILFDKKYLKKP